MPLNFRRGKEHMQKPERTSGGGGNFKPFLPTIYWRDDEESKYLWFLNRPDDMPRAEIIAPYTSNGRVERVIARQDPAIGESSDPIEDKWGYGPSSLNMAIAVELQPLSEMDSKGRSRPVSFEVKTRTFERRLRDKDGEALDESEEVEVPLVGIVIQSRVNFFNLIAFEDTNTGPVHESPLKITRLGTDQNTSYKVDMFDKPIEVETLLDTWHNISYLDDDDRAKVMEGMESAEEDFDGTAALGEVLVMKWLEEHAQQEWYNEVMAAIDTEARYPSQKYLDARKAPKDSPRRASSSKTRTRATVTETTDEPEASEPEPKVTRRSGTKTKSEVPVTKDSPVMARMQKIKEEQAARRAKASKA